MSSHENENQISSLAKSVLSLARDSIVVKYRFFDRALAAIELVEEPGIASYVSDAGKLSYDPAKLLNDYMNDGNYVTRLLLHVIFHSIFMHYSRKDIANTEYWDIACDIAVENAVLSLGNDNPKLTDTEVQIILSKLGKWVPHLTAEALYREFMVGGISSDSAREYARLFSPDVHFSKSDKGKEEITISAEQWEKISRRVAAELKSFSKDVRGGETILLNLKQGMRRKYDYDDIVRRFAVISEEIRVNPDEFDYVYYTYGLEKYKNMPLIEPLEYTDENKIREFVIAVDTSASVRGKLVEGFLARTYELLSEASSFSEKMNIHVIQCDSGITSDIVITSRSMISEIADNIQVKGFGATDFRPVFDYVGDMILNRQLTNLKGMIYFTDGYGIYPVNPPGYDCMFVFDREDEFRPPVPGWAYVTVFDRD
ncbi:MAG: hypothetical protein IKQ40_05210 [Lachnospiraceae bacterium]|nr:hypothetical protein [Lachnospiraceae bacterium]